MAPKQPLSPVASSGSGSEEEEEEIVPFILSRPFPRPLLSPPPPAIPKSLTLGAAAAMAPKQLPSRVASSGSGSEEDEDEDGEEDGDEEEEEEEDGEEDDEEEEEEEGENAKNVCPSITKASANSGAGRKPEEMFELYPYLAEEVTALQKAHPGLFNREFAMIDDRMARKMDEKIKKQRLVQMRLYLKHNELTKEVTKTLMDLTE